MSKTTRLKPKKPYRSFPLAPHPNGQWCKKIRGKLQFFGVWADPDAAFKYYLAVAPDLHAGRSPRASNLSAQQLCVKDLCNAFLNWQKGKMEAGEIRPEVVRRLPLHASCICGCGGALSTQHIRRLTRSSNRDDFDCRPRRGAGQHLLRKQFQSGKLEGLAKQTMLRNILRNAQVDIAGHDNDGHVNRFPTKHFNAADTTYPWDVQVKYSQVELIRGTVNHAHRLVTTRSSVTMHPTSVRAVVTNALTR